MIVEWRERPGDGLYHPDPRTATSTEELCTYIVLHRVGESVLDTSVRRYCPGSMMGLSTMYPTESRISYGGFPPIPHLLGVVTCVVATYMGEANCKSKYYWSFTQNTHTTTSVVFADNKIHLLPWGCYSQDSFRALCIMMPCKRSRLFDSAMSLSQGLMVLVIAHTRSMDGE